MKEKMVLYIFVLLIYQTFTEVLSCPTSTATISYVSSCPTNQAEWEKAARLKNCESIAVIQNCTTPDKFVYHCLMNQWRNATLEVCAPIFYIQGYCAEYNTRVKQVVENYNEGFECLTFPESQRCPPRYASNEAYKYQACYSYNQERTTTAKSVVTEVIYITKESRSEDNGVVCLEFIIVLCLLLPLFVIVLVLGFFINRERISKLFHERCTSRCTSTPSRRQSLEAIDMEEALPLVPNNVGDAPMIPDLENVQEGHVKEKDTQNIGNVSTEQSIKTPLPDEQKVLLDRKSSAPNLSEKDTQSNGNESTEQNIKTPLPDEQNVLPNMKLSAPTLSAQLSDEQKVSPDVKSKSPTVSEKDTDGIGNKSTEESCETPLPGEGKPSTNMESSAPTLSDAPPIPKSENVQEGHVKETDTESIGNESTEESIKTQLSDEQKVSPDVKSSVPHVSDAPPLPKSENIEEIHVNEQGAKNIGSKSTEESIKTQLLDEQKVSPDVKSSAPPVFAQLSDVEKVSPDVKSSAPPVSEKDTESLGNKPTEESIEKKDTESIGNKSTEQSKKTQMSNEQKVSSDIDSSAPTVSVEEPNKQSKKRPTLPPRPKLPSRSIGKKSPETVHKISEGKHSTASKLGKNKQAPSVPP